MIAKPKTLAVVVATPKTLTSVAQPAHGMVNALPRPRYFLMRKLEQTTDTRQLINLSNSKDFEF